MSVLICEACGEITQSDVCNHAETENHISTECYARMLEGTSAWIKGCAYDGCEPFMKLQADRLIQGFNQIKPGGC